MVEVGSRSTNDVISMDAIKLKLEIWIAGFGHGGAQKQCALLANALANRSDVQLTVIFFRAGVNYSYLDINRVNSVMLSSKSLYSPRNILLFVFNRCPDNSFGRIFSWENDYFFELLF